MMAPIKKMTSLIRSTLFLAGLILPFFVVAGDMEIEAAVAISIGNDQEMWVGQQVTLNLDLKTTGLSFSNSHFNLPEVSGAFLMQTDTTTIKLTEKIDGRGWQIVRYPLALYPQKPGQLVIPPIDVRFSASAGFGSQEKGFELRTRALDLSIKSPPGLKQGDLVVTTTSFELDNSWQPASGISRTGDALTLTVNRKAADISAMLLPPLPVYRADGLAAYPQGPRVNDKTDRGDLTGERTDRIIWVIENPGIYEIPGIRFQWWDPVKHELKQQIVPGQRLEILSSEADSPGTRTAVKPEQDSWNLLPWLLCLLAVFIAGSLWLLFGRRTGDQSLINERSAFANLQKACKNNHAGQAHSTLYTWLAFCSFATTANSRVVTLGEFARICNDKKLATELEHLQNALVSSDSNWRGSDLSGLLQTVRHNFNKQKKAQSKLRLAPINP